MIVEPPRRSRRAPRLGASRELALGIVAMSLLTAVLLGYFLGFYCDGREGFPCTGLFAQTPSDVDDGAPPEVPAGMAAPMPTVAQQLVPSQLFPPTAPGSEPAAPPTLTVPTTTPSPPPSPTRPTSSASPIASPTPRTPEAGVTATTNSSPGIPTNTLMPGTTPTAGPTPPNGYTGPPTDYP